MVGSLHVAAAHAVLPSSPDVYLDEADRLAQRTGDGTHLLLWFGPHPDEVCEQTLLPPPTISRCASSSGVKPSRRLTIRSSGPKGRCSM